ncbi:uncharacterized protein [Amphiura filiformis]|uniref:uncharacterized protein n=1 Tax=Amphiura filiformis TaxID=82378 RepID=UPI003B214E00
MLLIMELMWSFFPFFSHWWKTAGVVQKCLMSCLLSMCYAEFVDSCSYSSSPKPMPNMPMNTPISDINLGETDICGLNIHPVDQNGIMELAFSFHRKSSSNGMNVTGDPCMCLEGFEDGQNGPFEVQFYEGNCFDQLYYTDSQSDKCPAKPASITCNCTQNASSCLCNEDDAGFKADDYTSQCMLEDTEFLLTQYNTSNSRTCYRTKTDDKQRAIRAPKDTVSWVFCLCTDPESKTKDIGICECPDKPTMTEMTTTTSAPTPVVRTTEMVMGPNNSGGDSNGGSSNLLEYTEFRMECLTITPTTAPLSTEKKTPRSEMITKQQDYTPGEDPHARSRKKQRFVIVLTAGIALGVVIVICTIVCVCCIWYRRRKSDPKFRNISMEVIDKEDSHRVANGTADPSSDRPDAATSSNGYGHIAIQSANNAQPAGASLYAEPYDKGIRAEPAYAEPDVPSNRGGLSSGVGTYYAEPDIPANQRRYEEAGDALSAPASTPDKSKFSNAVLPPYAQVQKKNKGSGQSQASFAIIRSSDGYSDMGDSDQPNEYGQLQQPVMSANTDGMYQKLERGLNKEIVDSAR